MATWQMLSTCKEIHNYHELVRMICFVCNITSEYRKWQNWELRCAKKKTRGGKSLYFSLCAHTTYWMALVCFLEEKFIWSTPPSNGIISDRAFPSDWIMVICPLWMHLAVALKKMDTVYQLWFVLYWTALLQYTVSVPPPPFPPTSKSEETFMSKCALAIHLILSPT